MTCSSSRTCSDRSISASSCYCTSGRKERTHLVGRDLGDVELRLERGDLGVLGLDLVDKQALDARARELFLLERLARLVELGLDDLDAALLELERPARCGVLDGDRVARKLDLVELLGRTLQRDLRVLELLACTRTLLRAELRELDLERLDLGDGLRDELGVLDLGLVGARRLGEEGQAQLVDAGLGGVHKVEGEGEEVVALVARVVELGLEDAAQVLLVDEERDGVLELQGDHGCVRGRVSACR